MSIEYRQGATVVWTDGEKLVVTNRTGKEHVAANIDELFGKGTWNKVYRHKYSEELTKNPGRNPHSKTYEVISPIIPKRAQKDLKNKDINLEDYFGQEQDT